MKILTDLLHLLICQKPHEYDMLKISSRSNDVCYYYLECDISSTHELPDHVLWTTTSEQFITALEFSSPEDALEFVKKSIRISQEIKALTGESSLKMDFLISILT